VERDAGDARDEAIGHRGQVKKGQARRVNGGHRDVTVDPPGEGKIRPEAA
jgi:hypothetical protein